jgi:hypothetical protein
MVVYFFAGIFLSAIPDFITGLPADLAFHPKAICIPVFVMPVNRMEKHSCIFRIQPGKT